MDWQLLSGLGLALGAAVLQGVFLLPMGFIRKWRWEQSWTAFSLFGMFLLNWALAAALLPELAAVYRAAPGADILKLAAFGACWGLGAILFGLGMEKLGLSLGYPIIMGISASAGGLIPLFVLAVGPVPITKLGAVLAGTALAIAGIVLCSVAGANRAANVTERKGSFAAGLVIAITGGFLAALPNVGMAYGGRIIEAARRAGASEALAGNAVWALFFTMGAVVNVGYCLALAARRGSMRLFAAPGLIRNTLLAALMSLMWIGSFYLYGVSAFQLGRWGPVIGWPVFISASIGAGALAGVWKGEWSGAPRRAVRLLTGGLLLILSAVLTLAFANTL